ncbi:MAG TPA: hypothetical protein VGK98_13195 [Arthrobacter sp.]|uniref:hypothetical protein n=1 Tax=Arthrobacter sp. TaxID=1667 RepID=UPI002F405CBF
MFAEKLAPGAGVGHDNHAGLMLRRIGDRSDGEVAVGATALTLDRQHTGPAGIPGTETGKSE